MIMGVASSRKLGLLLVALACLGLAGCKAKRTPVPDELGPKVPCSNLTFGGFPKYAALGSDSRSRSNRPQPTFFVCRPGEYALEFDPNVRAARWSVQTIEPSQWEGKPAKRRNDVRPDPLLPKGVRNELSHWVGSPYVKLQLSPASFVDNDEVKISHTFYTSSMLAANPKILEANTKLNENIRRWAATRGRLVVFSGPIFDAAQAPQWIGPKLPKAKDDDTPLRQGKMAVPTFFFRVILDPKTGQSVAFVLPNGELAPSQLSSRMVSVSQVEQWAGISFFPRLDPSATARVRRPPSAQDWPLQ